MMEGRPGGETGLRPVDWIEQQAGVLAWLPGIRPYRVALVTSRRTGRWVVPKGAIDPGRTPRQAAALEALEEAGLVGTPDAQPVGRITMPKIRPPLIWTIEVALYPMKIERVLDVWIESGQRLRRLATIAEARRIIGQPDTLALAECLVADLESR